MKETMKTAFAFDKDFTPFVPTLVFTETAGAVAITVKLYGPLTPERVEREKKLAKYRVEQLTPIQRRPRIERTFSRAELAREPEDDNSFEIVRGGGRR
jgi:hypothetical protein